MAWTLFAISRYPEMESRIVAELEYLGLLASPWDPKPRELRLEDLSKLTYLNAVIKESMRYHQVHNPAPVAPLLRQTCLNRPPCHVVSRDSISEAPCCIAEADLSDPPCMWYHVAPCALLALRGRMLGPLHKIQGSPGSPGPKGSRDYGGYVGLRASAEDSVVC